MKRRTLFGLLPGMFVLGKESKGEEKEEKNSEGVKLSNTYMHSSTCVYYGTYSIGYIPSDDPVPPPYFPGKLHLVKNANRK